MSILEAKVQDFQSIADVSVQFGNFTVLVGPSNSGKSAFLRALRALVRNTFVPSNVRQGTLKSVIDVHFTKSLVGIERGKSLSTYKVGADIFTKSGRTVPTEVSRALEFPLIEGTDATFAFQFDKPFLLSEPGSHAAQVIGSLTNVSMLHTAVREANRRRQEAAGVLKVRQGDITRYTAQAEQFADLEDRRRTLEHVEDLLADARARQSDLAGLATAAQTARRAQQGLDSLTVEEPVDVSALLRAADPQAKILDRLTSTTQKIRRLATTLTDDAATARHLRDRATDLEHQHTEQLRAMGTCPTCGQVIA